ncbi:Crp/Fnr family transcriptional regulator [Hydrogenimonas sp. SS33]|uniref:Crp/Fnr family transcriptional regulator n=1 Tax=Hydrogenimonas leucolamina TaxID=2954236 RepID=UPI00336C0B05
MSTTAYLSRLEHTPLFGDLPREILKKMVSACHVSHWKKGQVIDNDEGTLFLNIIVRGRVKMSQTDLKTGRNITLFILAEGDVFDVLSLLDGQPHLSLFTAQDDVILLRVPMEKAREWLRDYPRFNARFLPYIGRQMRHLEHLSESLVFDDTLTRLAKLILHHTDTENGEPEGHPVRLINDLPHEVLAELIGTVRTVVTTQLRKLKEEEIVLRKEGRIVVTKLEALKKKYAF